MFQKRTWIFLRRNLQKIRRFFLFLRRKKIIFSAFNFNHALKVILMVTPLKNTILSLNSIVLSLDYNFFLLIVVFHILIK